jgi:predicted nucleotidyltransferase
MKRFDEKKIKEIAEKYELKLLLLFGSQVTGKTHKFSDFDFGYIGSRSMNYYEKGNLEVDLSRLIKKEADSADLRNVGPLLKYEIIKNNVILYQDAKTYEDFFVRTLREYFESNRLFAIRDNVIANKIKELKKVYAK